ncbi:catalase [Chryseobacterium rhizosphaerae]|uniref:Catalase-related peroxidase n=1 Tax=Chryseobacterium rhizosphaerae TaxID=395937 RepID=A0AAE3YC05_9FLAO|nr:catalase [Chryseobacterium rhizosphaerae]MDR6528625.1 catalase [Chryseobacterium rhizosphaerae]
MKQNNQYNKSVELIEAMENVLGYAPGFRAIHAGGRFYHGVFKATDIAKTYSKAIHLQGDEIPVTVRFSKGGTDPDSFFGPTLGMATRFYLPNGVSMNTVMLNMKLFFANSPEQLLKLLEAGMPLGEGTGPNLEGIKKFASENANVGYALNLVSEREGPVSFANTAFWAHHTFLYRNEDNKVVPARSSWIPVSGVLGRPAAELAAESIDVLYIELEERLAREKIMFDLVLELAEPNDPIDDPSAPWPADRKTVVIGRLTISERADEKAFTDPIMNHDPTQLTEGIETTDDPVLHARRGVYEASVAKRTGGWKGTTGGCPFGHG